MVFSTMYTQINAQMVEIVHNENLNSYPLDIDFVLELPVELRDLFHEWAKENGFDPLNPTGSNI